jgi:hypothetical protein
MEEATVMDTVSPSNQGLSLFDVVAGSSGPMGRAGFRRLWRVSLSIPPILLM